MFCPSHLPAVFCTLALNWPLRVLLFLLTSWRFLGYEFTAMSSVSKTTLTILQNTHTTLCCTSTESTGSCSSGELANIHPALWPAPPHRAVVVWGLQLAFLSRPVEIGLMKCWTLSECRLNVGCGIHLQLIAAEADHHTSEHTFVSFRHPLTAAYLLFLHPPSTNTDSHSLSLWNSSFPTHLFDLHACALSIHGEAPFTRQS